MCQREALAIALRKRIRIEETLSMAVNGRLSCAHVDARPPSWDLLYYKLSEEAFTDYHEMDCVNVL